MEGKPPSSCFSRALLAQSTSMPWEELWCRWGRGHWGKSSQLGMLLALCFNEIYFHFALLCFLVPRKDGKQSTPLAVVCLCSGVGRQAHMCVLGRSDAPPGLSATGRTAGEHPVEQKNPGSLICHHEIRPGPSAQRPGGSGIINWDVLEKQGALLPPPLLFPGRGSAEGAGAGTRSSG